MSGYDILHVTKHSIIAERAKSLLDVLSGGDAVIVADMMNTSRAIVDEHNKKNRTVIDTTKTEDGKWKSTVKKVVLGYYVNPVIREMEKGVPKLPPCNVCNEQKFMCDKCEMDDIPITKIRHGNYKRERDLLDSFRAAADTTTFPNELKCQYILLSRLWDWPNLNPLEVALRDAIHTKILKNFKNQNQQLIQKSCNQ